MSRVRFNTPSLKYKAAATPPRSQRDSGNQSIRKPTSYKYCNRGNLDWGARSAVLPIDEDIAVNEDISKWTRSNSNILSTINLPYSGQEGGYNSLPSTFPYPTQEVLYLINRIMINRSLSTYLELNMPGVHNSFSFNVYYQNLVFFRWPITLKLWQMCFYYF